LLLATTLALSACGSDADTTTDSTSATATTTPTVEASTTSAEPNETPSSGPNDRTYPDVVDVVVDTDGDRAFHFATTLSSPYDSPARYADAWRVTSTDRSVVYGIRELAHDHADEQPFTRSLSGVEIPDSVSEVLVEGRDQVNGWGGATLVVSLP